MFDAMPSALPTSPSPAAAPAGTVLLRLEGIRKSFPKAGTPLAGVDLSVRSGEFAVLTGKSGSGKSTLLAIAGLLLAPDAGRVFLEGRDVTDASEMEKARLRAERIGFVFQAFHLLPARTVLDNVDFRFRYLPDPPPLPRRRAAAMEALERVGLADAARRAASTLSQGEAQRVAIARAIVHPPAILLADEPTGNLDGENARAVMEIFRTIPRTGSAVLLVTHDLAWTKGAVSRWRLEGGAAVPGGSGGDREG
jgi:putative ABC transport system ATP-binding protein